MGARISFFESSSCGFCKYELLMMSMYLVYTADELDPSCLSPQCSQVEALNSCVPLMGQYVLQHCLKNFSPFVDLDSLMLGTVEDNVIDGYLSMIGLVNLTVYNFMRA